jgi:CheY-like chemotaxis protein
MQGIHGVETCRRLTAGGHRADLRCVIVTAHDEAAMWSAARGARIRHVLLKPVSASALHDALTEVLAPVPGKGARSPWSSLPSGDAFHTLRAERRGARVLLAEDNLVNQEVAVELLRSAGLEVDIAGNGAEAVAMAQAHAYDLILMDVQMPEVDGLQAARALRAMPAQRAVPIIAMTAPSRSTRTPCTRPCCAGCRRGSNRSGPWRRKPISSRFPTRARRHRSGCGHGWRRSKDSTSCAGSSSSTES